MVNARIQFSLRQNVEISRYTFEVFDRFEDDMQVDGKKPDISLRREGNLFLIDEKSRPDAEKALKMLQELGCEVYWMTPDDIREKFPLYDPSGYAGGTFSPSDGHFDAYSLLKAYKAKANSQGAEFIKGTVSEINRSDNKVTGVTLESGETYHSSVVVNCTGAWCADLAATAGVKLPIEPFGVGIEINSCETLAKEFGGECVSKVRYKMKQSDYRAEIRSTFAPEPEAVFYTAYGTEARLILRQAYEQGKTPPKGWYADYITMWTNEVSEMPEIAEGIKGLMPGASGEFYQEEYAKPYNEKYGRPPSTSFGPYGYDAAMLVALAIEKAGAADSDSIRKALPAVSKTYMGVTGDKTFDKDGMQASETYMKKIYTGGELKDYPLDE